MLQTTHEDKFLENIPGYKELLGTFLTKEVGVGAARASYIFSVQSQLSPSLTSFFLFARFLFPTASSPRVYLFPVSCLYTCRHSHSLFMCLLAINSLLL